MYQEKKQYLNHGQYSIVLEHLCIPKIHSEVWHSPNDSSAETSFVTSMSL